MATTLSAQDARDILAGALQGETDGKAAELATQKDQLPLDKTALIGIVGPTSAPFALIRQPTGTVLKVARGERSPVGTVRAIADGRVVLSQNGRTEILQMPGT